VKNEVEEEVNTILFISIPEVSGSTYYEMLLFLKLVSLILLLVSIASPNKEILFYVIVLLN
jgi:hypothetical protein